MFHLVDLIVDIPKHLLLVRIESKYRTFTTLPSQLDIKITSSIIPDSLTKLITELLFLTTLIPIFVLQTLIVRLQNIIGIFILLYHIPIELGYQVHHLLIIFVLISTRLLFH